MRGKHQETLEVWGGSKPFKSGVPREECIRVLSALQSCSPGAKGHLSLVANVVPRSAGAVVGLGGVLGLGLLLLLLLGLLENLLDLSGDLLLLLLLVLGDGVVDVGDRRGLGGRGSTSRGTGGCGGELRELEDELEDTLGADLLVDYMSAWPQKPERVAEY